MRSDLANRATIGWGLIGTGGICGRMAWALSQMADARLVAVGSRGAGRAQAFVDGAPERRGARAHDSYQALVDDPAVDVVYIGTPHPDHVHSMCLALAAGKAVLCEKPFTLNRAQAETAVALARSRGVFLMEAMWTRWLPAVVEAKRLCAGGRIGEVLSVAADFGFAAQGGLDHRTFDPALGGGALLDIGIYPLSLAAFLLGPIEQAQALAHKGATGVDVHTLFNLRHAGGALSQGLCSLRSTTPCAATIQGTAGRIVLEAPFHAAQALRVTGGGESPAEERIALPWRGDGFVYQAEEVHRCLRAGLLESPSMTLDESVALVGWMDEIRSQIGLRYPGEE